MNFNDCLDLLKEKLYAFEIRSFIKIRHGYLSQSVFKIEMCSGVL